MMPKFILLTKRDPTLGYTREADEMFKKNSEQQKEWMRRKLISHSPEEVNLNNLDLLDKCLKKFLKNQSLRSRPWLIAFVYLFIFFF